MSAGKGPVGSALVVGGGIGGMQAALDFAAAGIKAYLADSAPCIGGVMAQLDKTFPTNDCAMCTMAPRLVEISRHKDIEIVTMVDLKSIEGGPGDFRVTLRQRPRYVDMEKCNGCGSCLQVCAVGKLKPSSDPKRMQPVPDEFNGGLSYRPAIYIPYPQAIPSAAVIDAASCLYFRNGACKLCLKNCKAEAIDFNQKERDVVLNVGAVVLAPGYTLFDPRLRPEYGYGRFKNVVASLEFERILSASGPYTGHVLRPSDRKEPRRIAFIQCVGSRDNERDYCSAVCCMYATKEALLAREHAHSDLKCDIFFMDLRAYGKGFEEYYLRAREQGVRYIRCRPHQVEEDPVTNNLTITYLTDDDRKVSAEYDMVVLSAGLRPAASTPALAGGLGLTLNAHGFSSAPTLAPLDTPRPGVFAAGAFTEPKDIPETVMQTSGAVARALEILSESRGTLLKKEEFPPELPVNGEAPRVGVFVCHCGTNIAGVVNVPEVIEYARGLPDVVHAENLLYTCSTDSQAKIREAIKTRGLTRVIVAACTPRTHEPLFRNTVREAGLNPYLFEMANIRDQNSWVHMGEPEKATEKAKDLVRMALAKARLLEPLYKGRVSINRDVLVIGGGLSGMTAALSLARQGFQVHLVERERELGGNMLHLRSLLDRSADPRRHLEGLVADVRSESRITLHMGASLLGMDGSLGHFKTRLSGEAGREVLVEHGAIVVATGAEEHRPAEYMYGGNPRVITQRELEDRLARGEKVEGPVVMIQCVGSRSPERPNCSRICCGMAVKNALLLKEEDPAAQVYVLYRDIRTYGFREGYFTQARREGVVFARFEEDRKPEVSDEGGRTLVRFYEPVSREEVEIGAGTVVLSAGTVPRADTRELAQMLKVPTGSNGFLLEAHMKLRPVDFATEGIFLCGMAHYPKTVEESIAQANAAAARAAAVLANDTVEVEANISSVIDENCDGCAYCIDTCPFKALTLIEYVRDGNVKKTVEVNETLCKGCGTCMATCPKKGIAVRGFKLEQLSAMVGALLGGG